MSGFKSKLKEEKGHRHTGPKMVGARMRQTEDRMEDFIVRISAQNIYLDIVIRSALLARWIKKKESYLLRHISHIKTYYRPRIQTYSHIIPLLEE